SKFLFGGIFNIISRADPDYKVELDPKYTDLIGRLTIDYRGNNTRGTVFSPEYIFACSTISSVSQHQYQGERFASYDKINHSFESMSIVIKNEL
ncbi:hypothetical protein, partial [Parageobacillus thermoglucosidasius]|uniref:hypothetical protein n=1 Tax=Parageobacillus thermoglucosidasius TaxID=1426 RepID=UPI0030C6E4A7